ncbi:hypothetical protein [Streptosporangium roseum]|nr:hypothetical protein [Streptosporangium roseum]
MELRARYFLSAAAAVVVLTLTAASDGMGLSVLLCGIAVLFFLVCAFRA